MFSSGRYTTAAATALTLLASAGLVQGAGHLASECKPSLSIEVGVPGGASATEKFGETDYYLAANVDTVVWGYFDPNATAATAPVTMSSGETITVEVISHHSGHDVSCFNLHDTSCAIHSFIHSLTFCFRLFSMPR
mmetsp:Transcript_11343/g.27334  ORF Transcript_11343/g.27334 Transcript_11343/m.27334 type:complete len:136 (+) Transcript_11343:999-1406(+)